MIKAGGTFLSGTQLVGVECSVVRSACHVSMSICVWIHVEAGLVIDTYRPSSPEIS